MADQDPNEQYKDKYYQAILTDAGRQLLLDVAKGGDTLKYTRAVMTSLKPVDSNANQLDDEGIRKITKLPDDLKEGVLQYTPVVDNHFEIIADFKNKNQPADINFSAIGWYAEVYHEDDKGVRTQVFPETLTSIIFTKEDHETLAAGDPSGREVAVISSQLDVTISDKAKIDMTVNEIGYVTREELNSWQTKVTADFNGKIDANEKNTTITLRGKEPVKADENHNFNLNTYTKEEIDQMVAGAGKGAGINTVQGVAPDNQGNVNLGTVFYLKTEVDQKIQAQQAKIDALTKANSDKDSQITSLNQQMTGSNNQYNDLLNRVKFLEENAMLGKRFAKADESAAESWENQHPNYIAMIEDK